MPSKHKRSVASVKEPKKIALQETIEEVEGFLSSNDMDDSSEKKIAKELFSSKDLKTKTDLTDRQISLLTRGYFLASELEDDDLKRVFDTFIELRVSRKRKSRAEFIDALKGLDTFNNQNKFMNGLFGGNK